MGGVKKILGQLGLMERFFEEGGSNLAVGSISHHLHQIEDPGGVLHKNNIFSVSLEKEGGQRRP